MEQLDERLKEIAIQLFKIDAVKFGEFMTKSGVKTPVYFDLRVIVSHPDLMESISKVIYDFAVADTKCDHLCGVPYTALPIATLLSVQSKVPMLMRRKEAKAYGTKKMIEGQYKPGQTCLIIEDVVTSGSSVLETVTDLRKEGLQVNEAIIILDRQQGGEKALELNNVTMRSLFTLTQLVDILVSAGYVDKSVAATIAAYLAETQIQPTIKEPEIERVALSYEKRANLANNSISKKLFEIMAVKQTNLCLSADLSVSRDIIELVKEIGEHICLLKTHVDVIEDFNDEFANELTLLANKYNFLIMEDRKYADIGNTVSLQYSKGLYQVSKWADLVTVHSLPGEGVLKGIQNVLNGNKERGVFLLAEMSSQDNLISQQYTEATMKIADKYENLVSGIVCQTKTTVKHPGLIQLTPGVQLESVQDGLGQQYNSPENVILERGADIAAVGRGIYLAKNPKVQAALYRERLWESYLKRIQHQ